MPAKKTVELVQGKAFKLEPGKNYLLVFDERTVTHESVAELNSLIEKHFDSKVLAVVLRGDVDSVKVVEVPES